MVSFLTVSTVAFFVESIFLPAVSIFALPESSGDLFAAPFGGSQANVVIAMLRINNPDFTKFFMLLIF